MNISIKNYLTKKDINGNIILYRDNQHKKKGLCKYLAEAISIDKTICIYSGGAFGLYMAKAFPNNNVVICGRVVTEEYKQQIAQLSKVTVIKGKTNIETKEYAEANGYYFINQFAEPLIQEYYKNHFLDIVKEVPVFDAFCDCGHSCATLAGAIETGLEFDFILGVNRQEPRELVHYLENKKDKFVQQTTLNFDTKQIQLDIEAMYPNFGNIFEATRSISAAMSWLQKNPGKTVLVYVGDSPVFGEDATI